MKRFFGLFIILLLAISPFASATRYTTFPTNTHINDSQGDESTLLYTDSSDIDTSLSFNETMQYLTKGNKPGYIIINGDINNIQSCRFIISYACPTGYHDIKNNFKYNLHDEIYKSTILYDPEDFVWPTTFLTDSVSNPNVDQQAIFTLMVRNSQYVTLSKMDVPRIDDSDYNITFDTDPSIDDVYDIISKCYHIVNDVKLQFDLLSKSYNRQTTESYVHNLIISKAKGSDTSKYGGCYWPKFMGVSNDDLELLNTKYQTIKHYVKPAVSALGTAILHIGDLQLDLKGTAMIVGKIPEVGEYFKTGLEVAIYLLDILKQSISWQKNGIETEYNKADEMTWDISSEKSYRKLVDDGVLNPTTPTKGELQDYNDLIDEYKSHLVNLSEEEFNRIFNYGDLNSLQSNYTSVCQLYIDVIYTYESRGIRAPEKYYNYRDKILSYFGDINNVKDMNENEKKVWNFYKSILDNQYDMLENCKYHVD